MLEIVTNLETFRLASQLRLASKSPSPRECQHPRHMLLLAEVGFGFRQVGLKLDTLQSPFFMFAEFVTYTVRQISGFRL